MTHTYLCMCICLHECIYIVYMYAYLYIFVCIYTYMHYVCVYACMCLCVCMAMFLCAWRPEISTRHLPLHPLVETATLSLNPEAGRYDWIDCPVIPSSLPLSQCLHENTLPGLAFYIGAGDPNSGAHASAVDT